MRFFDSIIAFNQKLDSNAGIGTIIAAMAQYSTTELFGLNLEFNWDLTLEFII